MKTREYPILHVNTN